MKILFRFKSKIRFEKVLYQYFFRYFLQIVRIVRGGRGRGFAPRGGYNGNQRGGFQGNHNQGSFNHGNYDNGGYGNNSAGEHGGGNVGRLQILSLSLDNNKFWQWKTVLLKISSFFVGVMNY